MRGMITREAVGVISWREWKLPLLGYPCTARGKEQGIAEVSNAPLGTDWVVLYGLTL